MLQKTPVPVLTVGWVFFLLLSTALAQTEQPENDRPNVVWIMSEDNSKHYLELFDATGAPTPNIRQMAQQGVTFRHAFSNAPVCSVARTTLFSGILAPRLGTQFHRNIAMAKMPEGWEMFPALLRKSGYYTTNNSKTDYNVTSNAKVWDESSRKASWKNRGPKQPFFHVKTFTDSHESSLHFNRQWLENPDLKTNSESVTLAPYHPDTPLFRKTYARYHDRIGVIDQHVGDIIQELKDAGELENTFVFYFGDHGGVLPRGKGYVYESGLHVPLVVRVPEKWKSLSSFKRGSDSQGFVEFIDFAPTVLKLAGVEATGYLDGDAFLGRGVSIDDVEQRDSTLAYADRMDEKYDFCRSLRVGDWKYIRNFQAIYPDGLQNNYRYEMLAYQQWRQRFQNGQLNPQQSAFFQAKPVEQLFDLSNDPYEVQNLASDPANRQRLEQMRKQLFEQLAAMPDLSFYPESYLVDQRVVDHPIEFGREHRDDIARYMKTVNLALDADQEWKNTEQQLRTALASDDPVERYWAWTAASSIGEAAKPLTELAKAQAEKDSSAMVRLRAAEFLGVVAGIDPMPTIRQLLSESDSSTLNLMALQTVVLLQDGEFGFDTRLDTANIKAVDGQLIRRIGYLDGLSADEIVKRSREQMQKERKKRKN